MPHRHGVMEEGASEGGAVAQMKDCGENTRECCSLIIWLFMQNVESPPIRAGDL